MEPRQPGYEATNIRTKFQGLQAPKELVQRLKEAWEIARHANKEATFKAQKDYDQKAEPQNSLRYQLILLEDFYLAGRNSNNSPRFTGPHRILELKGESDVAIKMLNSDRKTTVHVNHLCPTMFLQT